MNRCALTDGRTDIFDKSQKLLFNTRNNASFPRSARAAAKNIFRRDIDLYDFQILDISLYYWYAGWYLKWAISVSRIWHHSTYTLSTSQQPAVFVHRAINILIIYHLLNNLLFI